MHSFGIVYERFNTIYVLSLTSQTENENINKNKKAVKKGSNR